MENYIEDKHLQRSFGVEIVSHSIGVNVENYIERKALQ